MISSSQKKMIAKHRKINYSYLDNTFGLKQPHDQNFTADLNFLGNLSLE